MLKLYPEPGISINSSVQTGFFLWVVRKIYISYQSVLEENTTYPLTEEMPLQCIIQYVWSGQKQDLMCHMQGKSPSVPVAIGLHLVPSALFKGSQQYSLSKLLEQCRKYLCFVLTFWAARLHPSENFSKSIPFIERFQDYLTSQAIFLFCSMSPHRAVKFN